MTTIAKKFIIKIPKNISIYYCTVTKFITVLGPLGCKSLKLKVNILVARNEKFIKVTRTSFIKMSSNQKKNLKSFQGTTVAIIKQIILDVSILLNKKLKLVGVGYKASLLNILENQVLNFKLGYSHQLYFKISNKLNNVYCLKSINIFIFSHSYQQITQIAALIRSYKIPEPYKGKGILYENEKIALKEGKKV